MPWIRGPKSNRESPLSLKDWEEFSEKLTIKPRNG